MWQDPNILTCNEYIQLQLMPSLERIAMQYVILIYVVLYIHVSACNETRVLYFAYGSNLLRDRLHINIPTAELYSTAYLQVRFSEIRTWKDRLQAIRN